MEQTRTLLPLINVTLARDVTSDFATVDQTIVLSDWLPRDAKPADENTEVTAKGNYFLADMFEWPLRAIAGASFWKRTVAT